MERYNLHCDVNKKLKDLLKLEDMEDYSLTRFVNSLVYVDNCQCQLNGTMKKSHEWWLITKKYTASSSALMIIKLLKVVSSFLAENSYCDIVGKS